MASKKKATKRTVKRATHSEAQHHARREKLRERVQRLEHRHKKIEQRKHHLTRQAEVIQHEIAAAKARLHVHG